MPELVDVHRFVHQWERTASLSLRKGDPDVVFEYLAHDRVQEGDTEDMADAAYHAWRADQRAGRASVLVSDSNEAGETQLLDEAPIDSKELRDRLDLVRVTSAAALNRELLVDDAGAIVPRDAAELAASAGQVDNIGKSDFSAIRALTSIDSDGQVNYLVIIPSTQQWWPINGPAAHDFTADLYNLACGGSSQAWSRRLSSSTTSLSLLGR